VNKPQILNHLKNNIRQEIEDTGWKMFKKVIENSKRADLYRAAGGGHLVDIIFKNCQTKNLNTK
jgi:fructose 1,6-bisphosphatase